MAWTQKAALGSCDLSEIGNGWFAKLAAMLPKVRRGRLSMQSKEAESIALKLGGPYLVGSKAGRLDWTPGH
jgi:hypothetical protein